MRRAQVRAMGGIGLSGLVSIRKGPKADTTTRHGEQSKDSSRIPGCHVEGLTTYPDRPRWSRRMRSYDDKGSIGHEVIRVLIV